MKSLIPAAILVIAVMLAARGPQDPSPSLRDDGRVATVTDAQGTALVRPTGRARWSRLLPRSVLLAGDQVRTPARGAHAAELQLHGGGSLVLGPGTLVELVERRHVRLLRGDVEVKGSEKSPVVCVGPGDFRRSIEGTLALRARDRVTATLDVPPRWLTGYRASTTDEWMGSLLATVDGRDVPLSVGYHSVDAVIRDQIAQTTVEQSFRNSTKNRLEGVFYFPLPADASISGFGMWIGDELVEADIVEKQRARAIYEDILRRKKDPGLLEWSGGNLFKARVFPIEPHSEKRIRLRYTQVLPLEGSTLRYRYALRSELLRSNPLERLQIKVSVFSNTKIKAIASPTHEVRARNTDSAATVEFDAESYAPDRDFEAAVTLEGSKPLVATSHRRGDDGYFMLQVSPPGDAASPWKRNLLPEGEALDVLVMADTSGSMDEAARGAQSEFVAGLLELLGSDDRFRLLTCDIDVNWFRDATTAATPAAVAEAIEFLEQRSSLGWTDLDLAFTAAAERAAEHTLVIYVGDGISTTGDADPVAMAERLARLMTKGAAFHSVSTGATFERGVLEAIAQLGGGKGGGGSTRAAGDDPAQSAYRLLAEVAQPALTDLSLEINGLRTARVYPEKLPPLAAGTQQIVLGRYLPGDGAGSGEVIVTGTRGGERVRFTAPISIPQDEAGNSFLPRLWARRHLDALLAKGRSAAVQEEIVAFSQRFDILTPFTSFLVLESDEDRERYGVTRRVKMRDGELFFAAARDSATTEVLRQQMKKARSWRLRLRARMLREIARLGEDLPLVAIGQSVVDGGRYRGPGDVVAATRYGGRGGGSSRLGSSRRRELGFEAYAGDIDVEEPTGEGEALDEELAYEEDFRGPMGAPAESGTEARQDRIGFSRRPQGPSSPGPARKRAKSGYLGASLTNRAIPSPAPLALGFPGLGGPPEPPVAYPDPPWDREILDLIRQIDRRPRLAALDGGVKLRALATSLHALHGKALSRQTSEAVVTSGEWFARSASRGGQTTESWLVNGQRGVVAAALRLGRRRPSVERDVRSFSFPLVDDSLTELTRRYRHHRARISRRGTGEVVIVLSAPAPRRSELELTIDPDKGLLVASRVIEGGYLVGTTVLREPVRVGGQWWATTVEKSDDEDRVVWRMRLEVSELDTERATRALRDSVAGYSDVLFVKHEEPDLDESKQAVHDGSADLGQRLRVVSHWAATQQWDRVMKSWEATSELVGDKPGGPWIHAALLSHARRGEELLSSLSGLAAGLDAKQPQSVFLANYAEQIAGTVLDVRERLRLHGGLKDLFTSDGDDAEWLRLQWLRQRADLLSTGHRHAEALKLREQIAREDPRDLQAQTVYLRALLKAGRGSETAERAEALLGDDASWLPGEADQIFVLWTDALWLDRRLTDLVTVLERWTGGRTRSEAAYVRYLTILFYAGREIDADRWLRERMAADLIPRDRVQLAELGGAIQMALGRGWSFWASALEERWHAPLGALARRLVAAEGDHWALAPRILDDYRFRRTDAHAELQAQLLDDALAPEAIELMPVDRLQRYIERVPWGRAQIDADRWRSAVDRVRARWSATVEPDLRHYLGGQVLALLDAHEEREEALAFARERLGSTDAERKPDLAAQLMQRLASGDWTADVEKEMFALLPLLERSDEREADGRRGAATAIRSLAAKLYAGRLKAELGPVEELEQLPRAERKERTQTARKTVREALQQSFAEAVVDAPALRKPWLEIERLSFAVRGVDPAAVEAAARELLTAIPGDAKDLAWRVLRERTSLVMAFAATRRGAPEGLGGRVLERYATALRDGDEKLLDWKYQMFRLLIALDRSADLERELRTWIVPGRVDSTWRTALGYLLAERGAVAEATTWFEQVERDDELTADDFAVLSNWYLVLGADEKREAARFGRFRAMSVSQLQTRVRLDQQRLSRRGEGIPESLDSDTLLALRALLSKATQPSWYIGELRQIYQSTKDVRVLASLADGVIGHSAQAAYGFLERCSRVLSDVHEEATCDVLIARLTELDQVAKTAADRRALNLLRARVQQRAGEVLDQPGPHLLAGIEAMTAAFEGEFRPGEGLQYSAYLASLGRLGERRYGEEQLRQLEVLFGREEPGRAERLSSAWHLARTRWAYEGQDAAIDSLSAALFERRQAVLGGLPRDANHVVQGLINWLENRKSFGIAERLLRAELAEQEDAAQKNWYRNRLFQLYTTCLQHSGVVSMGRGSTLYKALEAQFEKTMWSCSGDQVGQVVDHFCTLHRVAHHHAKIRSAAADLSRFARDRLPEVLTRMMVNPSRTALSVARALRDLDEPRSALELLVMQAEREPTWQRRVRGHIWRSAGHEMGALRARIPKLGALGERLLVVVNRELEDGLRTAASLNQPMIHRKQKHFWSEKSGAFAAVAYRVLTESKDRAERTLHVANYLWQGLALHDEAIVVLADAETRGVLHENGRWTMVRWLHEKRRYRESLPVLKSLVASRPDTLHYRTASIVALHETDRDDEAVGQVDAVLSRFKERGQWNEQVLAPLAEACLKAELFERSASFYDELIALHQRTRRDPGTQATYYSQAARAYLGLGKTQEAVDRASAAVVAWGPQQSQRRGAIAALRDVLAGIEDLAAFVAERDELVASSGLDAPLMRKLLGLVYLDRGAGSAAIVQLQAARDLDPLDTETHQALVRAFDTEGDPKGALAALRTAVRVSPMDLTLYTALADRLRDLGRVEEAERAWTTVVEVKPNEADGHRLLAQHREKQERYGDAVGQWQQVVRVRTDEPDGWLSLAQAQIRASMRDEARQTLRHVLSQSWHERFGDVGKRATELLRGL